MKFIAFAFTFLCFVICTGELVQGIHWIVSKPKCLAANEIDPDSLTGSHLTVKILEETDRWYVTGAAWDHLTKEWVNMDYKVIDKKKAPGIVTVVNCPAPYKLTEDK
jgi:hypothetical protein